MDTLPDMWRRARFNQHLNRALATRYCRLELWSSIIVALGSSGSVMAVVATGGGTISSMAACVCAALIVVRPLTGWGKLYGQFSEAAMAWRSVEELCEDGASLTDIARAQRHADRQEPVETPWRLQALSEWAYNVTNQQLPPERFA